MMAKVTFVVVAGFFSISSASLASCSSCPKSSGSIDDFIARISEALLSSEQNVMLIRALSSKEMNALVEDIPTEEFMQMTNAGHMLTAFKVIDSLNPSPQIVARYARMGTRISRSPEGFSGAFVPEESTEWLVITSKGPALSATSTDVSRIDLIDEFDGILSAKSDNRFGINVASFLADLKVVKNAILTKEVINPSNLQTGIGRAVLKKVIAINK